MDGYITVEEFFNTMTEWMRIIDEDVWPIGQPPLSRELFLSHCEALRYDVARRAKHNIQEATSRNKIAVKKDEATKAKEEASAATNRDEWRRRTALGRDAAKKGGG